MKAKRRVPALRGRASHHFGFPRVGCDRISLPRASPRRKIAPNTPGIRRMSDCILHPTAQDSSTSPFRTVSMSDSERDQIAHRVCSAFRVPGMGETYALVPATGAPVTFYAQQKRALNLIWALHRVQGLESHSTVAVVGAGLSGITAATGAAALGCKVALFDKAATPFHDQQGNHTRYISPKISDWPDAASLDLHTDLPFLNWTANICSKVITEIKSQWEGMGLQIQPFFERDVTDILLQSGKPYVKVEFPFVFEEYNFIILCTGFGEEKSVEGFRSH